MAETRRSSDLAPAESLALSMFEAMARAGCNIPETLAAIYTAGVQAGLAQANAAAPAAQLTLVPPPPPKDSVPTCPYEQIVALYHEILPNLPQVRLDTKRILHSRQKAMRELWCWVFRSRLPDGGRRAETVDQGIGWFRRYFERATHSDFIMGRTNQDKKHQDWRADLDYLLSDAGLKRVAEKTQEA